MGSIRTPKLGWSYKNIQIHVVTGPQHGVNRDLYVGLVIYEYIHVATGPQLRFSQDPNIELVV